MTEETKKPEATDDDEPIEPYEVLVEAYAKQTIVLRGKCKCGNTMEIDS